MERKSETLNLQVTPEQQGLVGLTAEREHNTLFNFQVLGLQYCTEHAVAPGKKESSQKARSR